MLMINVDHHSAVLRGWPLQLTAILKGWTYREPLLHEPYGISVILAADDMEFAALRKFASPLDGQILLKAPFKRIVLAASASHLRKNDRVLGSFVVGSQRGARACIDIPFTKNGLNAVGMDAADFPLEAELKPAHPLNALAKHRPFQLRAEVMVAFFAYAGDRQVGLELPEILRDNVFFRHDCG